MLKRCVCGKHRVVWLDDRRRQLGRRVHAKFELRLLAIVCREAFEEEGTKTGSSAAAEGVEDKEALEATAVVRESADLVHSRVDKLLANSIVTACIYKQRHRRVVS
jgi:hypothetical protein